MRRCNILSLARTAIAGAFVVASVLGGEKAALQTKTDPASLPAFSVVSVRPVKPFAREPIDFRVQPGGRITATNLTLDIIIREAFGVKGYQIGGGPHWLSSDRFDIEANADDDPPRKVLLQMLQRMLADRCQLRYHWQTKQVDVYALVLAKGQPKLKPSTADRSFVRLIRNTPADQVGVSYTVEAQRASMSLFAARLGEIELGRPVVDRTGLKGDFDFSLSYSEPDDPDSGPQIFTAIREQLGLKLKAEKGEIPILTIDHIEKPSEN